MSSVLAAAASYRPPLASAFPCPPAPGPLSIPPAQPPIFLSPPNQAGAAPAQPGGTLGNIGQSLANGINNHALTLMALGAGIAQGGVGQGWRRPPRRPRPSAASRRSSSISCRPTRHSPTLAFRPRRRGPPSPIRA